MDVCCSTICTGISQVMCISQSHGSAQAALEDMYVGVNHLEHPTKKLAHLMRMNNNRRQQLQGNRTQEQQQQPSTIEHPLTSPPCSLTQALTMEIWA